ncbi:hypothetical protein F511_37212 [Dorcoceras hygrometricum]|uniref:Uncharacterized protein n=1 Tax=Dorcoceras hygrometricum TaxID=472368 RepID=A0A2Z7A9Q2_9LAMI|nr:hypothetical protein F511_37212 [Dorcoceras hygrometricum]
MENSGGLRRLSGRCTKTPYSCQGQTTCLRSGRETTLVWTRRTARSRDALEGFPEVHYFSNKTQTSNAYVIHAKQPRDADVIKSANRFTERSLNSNAYVIHMTTTHVADVMRSATRFHPKFENIEISRIVPNTICDPKMQPQTFKMKSESPEITKTRLIQQLILNTISRSHTCRDRTCSDHFVVEIPFVANSSALLVQTDEGVLFPVVDRIMRSTAAYPCESGRIQAPRRQQGNALKHLCLPDYSAGLGVDPAGGAPGGV